VVHLPRPAALTAAAACLLLAGCTTGEAGAPVPAPSTSATSSTPEPTIDYVALGDSYSAGPLVTTVRSDPSECGRSTDNYPAFLADWLDVRSYRDVTCSGASTEDLTGRQDLYGVRRVPPQLDALSAETDLVTVGLGGNDFGIFSALSGCARQAGQTGSSCAVDHDALERDAGRVEARLARGLERVARQATEADVYVIGYPRVLPERGTCRQAGLAADAVAATTRVQQRLNASLAGAADAAGATYVDLWDASTGHDICAGPDAWVNGTEVLPGEAAPFHPFLAGMRGVAVEAYREITGEEAPEGAEAEPDPDAVVRNRVPR
jgi:lysophospholipase L1-like esterase